jgi:peptidyl-prolyl cis-trans isomerase A (cyclophilin A)
MIILSTSMGDITIAFFNTEAPVTVKNFLQYVDDGFFDGTIFHRVIPEFVIQGGGFTTGMKQKKTRPPIQNEAGNGLKNERGTLSMARTQEAHSATSQFFINLKDNAFLDHGLQDFGYAVFARVINGMEIVGRIASVTTGAVGIYQDVPLEPVVILSAKRT